MTIPRGTTPTLSFALDADAYDWTWGDLADIRVDILNGCQLVTRGLSECAIDGDTLTCELTEAETLMWRGDATVEIQVCVEFANGAIAKSGILKTTAGRILNEDVM